MRSATHLCYKDGSSLSAEECRAFADTAREFAATITIATKNMHADAKSASELGALTIRYNDRIDITAEGDDAPEAVQTLRLLLDHTWAKQAV